MAQQLTAAIKEKTPAEDSAVVEDRRLRVQSLRLRRMSTKAIAAILGEPVDVVESDLKLLEESHTARFGPAPSINPAQEIGWAVADFEEMENVAWMEFTALKQEAQQRKLSPMYVARARQGWIRTAAMMRVLRLKLLGEHGYLLPQASTMSTPGAGVPRADELRALLRAEGLLLEVADAVDKKALLADNPPTKHGDDDDFDPVAMYLEAMEEYQVGDAESFFGGDENESL